MLSRAVAFPTLCSAEKGRKQVRLWVSALVAFRCWWHSCRVSCTFWRTGEAPCSGGGGQEKQGEGCVVATSMLGLLGSLGRMLWWRWQVQPPFLRDEGVGPEN